MPVLLFSGTLNLKDSLYQIDSVRTGASTVKKQIFYYKTPVPADLTDVKYKKDSTLKGTKYSFSEPCNAGITTSCSNDGGDCYYYVYYPKSFDTTCKLPCIILFHGGGFSDCKGDGTAGNGNTNFVAREMAKRGYVAISAEYRTGRYLVPLGRYVGAQQVLAQYRAIQDGRGVVKTVITKERNHYYDASEKYRVDTNKIFIGGNSAGALIAIHTAYYDSTQIRQVFPTPPGLPTAKDVLGSIDANYYYGDSTIDVTRRIRGVLSMWGQASFPVSDSDHLDSFWKNNYRIPPMIAFHGAADGTLPIDTTNIVYSPNTNTLPQGKRIKM